MEDITVKCPKCRLKFSTPLPHGATSADCVCPRCGMPFMHNVKIEVPGNRDENNGKEIDKTARVANTEVNSHDNDVSTTDNSKNAGQQTGGNIQDATSVPDSVKSPLPFEQPSFDTMRKIRQKQRRLIYRFLCAGIVIVMLLLIFIIRSYQNSHGNRAADVMITESGEAMDERLRIIADTPAVSKRNKDAGPDWLQGTWVVNTDFGNITIIITDNKIIERSGGKTLSGTFYYTWSKLNCNFGDGKTFVYFLDEDRQLIDAGDGLFMRKIQKKEK